MRTTRVIVVAAIIVAGVGRSASGQAFTDDPLTAGMPIRAVHVNELRQRVTLLRTFVGLPAAAFTDPMLVAGVVPVRAAHILELRSALDAVFDHAAVPRPVYSTPVLAGAPIRAVDITELRAALNSIVNTTGACLIDGGALVNGAQHCGVIGGVAEVDRWTFTGTAGDRVTVHVGERSDFNDFQPALLVVAEDLTVVSFVSGTSAASAEFLLPSTGTYTVDVSSNDSLARGIGGYRLTMARSAGAVTVSPGDEGGPIANGTHYAGEIETGDLDVWTFSATAGDRISLHLGEIVDHDDFRPWVRVWAPNGAVTANVSGLAATAADSLAATVTGTYVVIVASFDAGLDGSGTYRLELARSSGIVTIGAGDQGGPLVNGTSLTGEIVLGDVDVWTFSANAGDRIGVHLGEIVDTTDFRPWLRVYAPSGTVLSTTTGTDAANLDGGIAPVAGTYLVLVASFDSGFDGTGTYRLELARTSGAVAIAPGDQGGPLGNGTTHTGEIVEGDVDVWTFFANAGDRIAAHAGEMVDHDDFRPWLRVWAPNGASVANTSGVAATAIDSVVAPVSGVYLVLVASFDAAFNGTGTYQLTVAHTPGPIDVSAGDQGGPLTNGGLHTGGITLGDLDVWTFEAAAGERIAVHIGETAEVNDFRLWLRIYAPNGAVLANTSGVAASAAEVVAPVSGTYLVLVASFDSGFDGAGSYRLTAMHTSGPITVSAGDQGGGMTNLTLHPGEILPGDLDVWTISVTAGTTFAASVSQTAEIDDFVPWLRVFAPNGGVLSNVSGASSAATGTLVAPVTGTYYVLVASFDSGLNGNGSYSVFVSISGPP